MTNTYFVLLAVVVVGVLCFWCGHHFKGMDDYEQGRVDERFAQETFLNMPLVERRKSIEEALAERAAERTTP